MAVHLAGSVPPANAQQAASPPVADAAEDTVKLNPFTVNTSRDVGFVAASSLAGGKLAGDLKDTPVSYTVLTREFIQALDLNNVVAASQWLPNTGTSVTNGQTEINGNPVSLTFRGVAANALTRNFFRLGVNYDSYNVERYDMARGPNAILFGNGGIGGTANVVTKTATPEKTSNELQVSYGSWENIRVSADVNSPLSKRVAIRTNLLWQERSGWRDWEAEQKKAATLAVTFKLTANTDIQLEAEAGRISRINPTYGMNDGITGWDGKTTFAGSAATLPTTANAMGVARFGSSTSPYFVIAPGIDSSGVINLANTARTMGGNETTQTPIGGTLVVGTGIQASTWPTLPADASVGLPASRFDLALTGSRFSLKGAKFGTSANIPTSVQPYQTYTLTANHRVGDLFLQVSGNWAVEERRNAAMAYASFNTTYVDLNQTLPSGAPNPFYLQPYNQSIRRQPNFYSQPTSVRASAAYISKGNSWGDFSSNLAGGIDFLKSGIDQTDFVAMRAADHRLWPTQDRITYRYYWIEGNRPAPEVLGSVNYGGTAYPVGWVKDTTDPSLGAQTDTRNPYAQFAGKATLLQRRIHLLGAVRYDSYVSKTQSSALPGDYPLNWTGDYFIARPSAPNDYNSLRYTPKDAAGLATGPAIPADARPRDASGSRLAQYANDRFRDDYSSPNIDVTRTSFTLGAVGYVLPWLSGYANYATSFNPNTSRLRIYGSAFSPQLSGGWDVGVRVTAGSKLSISLSNYRGKQQNEAFDTTLTLSNAINGVLNANAVGDLSSGGRNTRGIGNVPAQFFDSRDRDNRGWELESVANLAPGWRLLFNGSIAQANQTNSYRDFTSYWGRYADTFRQIVIDAGGVINANGTASSNATVPAGQAPDVSAAVAGWNTIQTTLANIASGPQKVTRLVESGANLFTDYTIQEGMLKGLRIGGGANYRGREVIGFRGNDTIRDPANPTSAIDDPRVDAYTAVYADPYVTATLTLGYSFKLNKKYRVGLNFKVDNLFNYDDPRYYTTLQRPPGGDVTNPGRVAVPGPFYYIQPRGFTATARLNF